MQARRESSVVRHAHWVLLHQQRRLHAVQVLHFIFQEPGQALRSVVKEHLEGVPVTLVTLPRLMQRAQQGLSKGLTNLRHKNLLPAEQIASGLLGEISGVPAWQGQLKPDLIVVTAFLPGRPVRMGFAFSVHNLMVAAVSRKKVTSKPGVSKSANAYHCAPATHLPRDWKVETNMIDSICFHAAK
eukprot:204193-Pelagomonas_calceolata.AAC.3